MIENNKVKALALPDLIILLVEISVDIYTNNSSVCMLLMDSLMKIIHQKNSYR